MNIYILDDWTITKIKAGQVINNYYNIDTAIIRPFNVYGPGMGKHDYRMVPNLMRAAIEGKKIRKGVS